MGQEQTKFQLGSNAIKHTNYSKLPPKRSIHGSVQKLGIRAYWHLIIMSESAFLALNPIARSDIASKQNWKHVDHITKFASGPNRAYWNLALDHLADQRFVCPNQIPRRRHRRPYAPTAESDLSPNGPEDCFLLEGLQIIELLPSCRREHTAPIIAGR